MQDLDALQAAKLVVQLFHELPEERQARIRNWGSRLMEKAEAYGERTAPRTRVARALAIFWPPALVPVCCSHCRSSSCQPRARPQSAPSEPHIAPRPHARARDRNALADAGAGPSEERPRQATAATVQALRSECESARACALRPLADMVIYLLTSTSKSYVGQTAKRRTAEHQCNKTPTLLHKEVENQASAQGAAPTSEPPQHQQPQPLLPASWHARPGDLALEPCVAFFFWSSAPPSSARGFFSCCCWPLRTGNCAPVLFLGCGSSSASLCACVLINLGGSRVFLSSCSVQLQFARQFALSASASTCSAAAGNCVYAQHACAYATAAALQAMLSKHSYGPTSTQLSLKPARNCVGGRGAPRPLAARTFYRGVLPTSHSAAASHGTPSSCVVYPALACRLGAPALQQACPVHMCACWCARTHTHKKGRTRRFFSVSFVFVSGLRKNGT